MSQKSNNSIKFRELVKKFRCMAQNLIETFSKFFISFFWEFPYDVIIKFSLFCTFGKYSSYWFHWNMFFFISRNGWVVLNTVENCKKLGLALYPPPLNSACVSLILYVPAICCLEFSVCKPSAKNLHKISLFHWWCKCKMQHRFEISEIFNNLSLNLWRQFAVTFCHCFKKFVSVQISKVTCRLISPLYFQNLDFTSKFEGGSSSCFANVFTFIHTLLPTDLRPSTIKIWRQSKKSKGFYWDYKNSGMVNVTLWQQ